MFMIKKFLSAGIILIITLSGCTSNNHNTNKTTEVVGGYTKADVNDPEIIKVAGFAASQIKKGQLEKVLDAKTQVVAGINYKLDILLTNGMTYEVVVYKDLKGVLELVSATAK